MKKLIALLIAATLSLSAQAQTVIRPGGATFDASTGSFLGFVNINNGREERLTATLGTGLTATSVVCLDASKVFTSTCTSTTPSFGATTVTTLAATGAASAVSVLATGGAVPNAATTGPYLWAQAGQALVSLVDSTRTVDNRNAAIDFSSGGMNLRFWNDAFGAAAIWLQGVGGQAGGITAINSNSGTGVWTHTGTFKVSNTVNTTAPVTAPCTAHAYTVAATDNYVTANDNATCTFTLPTASTNTGRSLTVRTTAAFTVVSNASNVVPCVGGAAAAAILAATAGKWAQLVSDGTNWIIMACN